jgi:hypothetical protein
MGRRRPEQNSGENNDQRHDSKQQKQKPHSGRTWLIDLKSPAALQVAVGQAAPRYITKRKLATDAAG